MRQKYILFLILTAYAALVAFGLYNHEPWRDEAHAWVAARDNTVSGILGDVKYDGVPPLWFLILMPFAKMGLPFETIQIIHWFVAVAAVGLFLFYGKFPLIFKILFPFSYYLAYEFAVISRNYVLDIFFLFAIASVYKDRFHKSFFYILLLIGLLLSNFHGIIFAETLGILFVYEVRMGKRMTLQTGGAIVLFLITSLLLFVLLMSGYTAGYTGRSIEPWTGSLAFKVFTSAVVPRLPYFSPYPFFSLSFDTLVLVCTMLLFIFTAILIRKNLQLLLLAIGQIGTIFYVNSVWSFMMLRHRGLILITLVFILWLAGYHRNEISQFATFIRVTLYTVFILLLAQSVLYTVYVYKEDYRWNFSAAKEMAQFIREKKLDTDTIVTYGSGYTESVRAYLPEAKFWYAEYETSVYHNTADQRFNDPNITRKKSMDEVVSLLPKNFPDQKPLLLLPMELDYPMASRFRYLYSAQSNDFWEVPTEDFWLYELR